MEGTQASGHGQLGSSASRWFGVSGGRACGSQESGDDDSWPWLMARAARPLVGGHLPGAMWHSHGMRRSRRVASTDPHCRAAPSVPGWCLGASVLVAPRSAGACARGRCGPGARLLLFDRWSGGFAADGAGIVVTLLARHRRASAVFGVVIRGWWPCRLELSRCCSLTLSRQPCCWLGLVARMRTRWMSTARSSGRRGGGGVVSRGVPKEIASRGLHHCLGRGECGRRSAAQPRVCSECGCASLADGTAR